MGNICIIPARYGSKRIKDKNIRPFCGKPIIEYAIESAFKSELFDMIIIYTNDIKIIADYPDLAVIRSQENANDIATLTDTLLEALGIYEKFNNACLLLPTAVFTTSGDIIKAYNLLKDNDAVISVCKYSHPIERAFRIYNDKFMFFSAFNEFRRTQDFPEAYHDAGQFYWLNVKAFKEQKRIFMGNSHPYIMDAIDIDNESDWIKAEAIFERTRILAK